MTATIGGGSNGSPKDTIHDLNHLQVAAICAIGVKHGKPQPKPRVKKN